MEHAVFKDLNYLYKTELEKYFNPSNPLFKIFVFAIMFIAVFATYWQNPILYFVHELGHWVFLDNIIEVSCVKSFHTFGGVLGECVLGMFIVLKFRNAITKGAGYGVIITTIYNYSHLTDYTADKVIDENIFYVLAGILLIYTVTRDIIITIRGGQRRDSLRKMDSGTTGQDSSSRGKSRRV